MKHRPVSRKFPAITHEGDLDDPNRASRCPSLVPPLKGGGMTGQGSRDEGSGESEPSTPDERPTPKPRKKLSPKIPPRPKMEGVENDTEQLFDVEEAAGYLRVTVPAIYTMVSRGELACHKMGKRRLRFRKKDLDAVVI